MKVYIAGKITGNKNYKQDFSQAEKQLTETGHIVMNPSFMPEGLEQREYHHVCMSMIDICEAIYFLPSWVDSKGAHLEYGYAVGKGKKIEFLQERIYKNNM
jgi:nucleoside 2-deoxyribosyltransferase